MSTIRMILEALEGEMSNPGEVVIKTKLPRYEVLAAFHILEELDLVEVVYSKGSHKVYQLTNKGLEVLEALKRGEEVEITHKTKKEEIQTSST
jgi:predicted transcriptional regulator